MSTLFSVVALAALAAAPSPGGPIRRFGLFVGSNDGGPGRVQLHYAASDARSVARVLEQLGGLAREDATLLSVPDRRRLREQLDAVGARVAQARASGARAELIFYYSGHADESGLLLGDERMSYRELREAIDRVPAQVRLAILDSCHAGSFVRLKGGKRIAPFLLDASSAIQGHAFLSASSADESAQESDRIRSSYFTFALLTGLRGAADASGDGRVTLSEAYQFAFQQTLADTERSVAGPQHPAYDIQLAGTGDLVMTDLRAQSAGLVIPADLAGRIFIRDASGQLLAELHHAAGHALELGLEPGNYGVTLEGSGGRFEARVSLAEGRRAELRRADFTPAAPGEQVVTRGAEPERVVPFNLSFFPALSLAGDGPPPVTYIGLNVLAGRVGELRGVEFGLVNVETRHMLGAQFGLLDLVGGDVEGVQYGLANWNGGSAYGLQNGLYNGVGHDVWGMQVGLVNDSRGAVVGAQLGLWNQAGGAVHGLQNGLVDIAGDLEGVQYGLYNQAQRAKGVQAGFVNVALEASSVQLGLVNVGGRVRFPVGLVNVADDAEAPVGLVNWVRHGYRAVGAWGSDVAAANLGVKLGGRWTYGLVAVATQPLRSPSRHFLTFGLGAHLPVRTWFLDLDATASMVFTSAGMEHSLLPTALRLVAIRDIWRGVSITAGPTLNAVVGWDGADADLALLPQLVDKAGRTTVRLFPGFVLGLQI